MKRGWKLLKKKLVYPQQWAAVEAWDMRLPRGGERTFYVNRGIDFVMVAAVTQQGRMIVPRQYYVAKQKKMPTLVAGYIDKGEQPLQAAKRELLEETGYKARRMVKLGTSIKGKYMTGTIYHFLALDAKKIQEQALEPTEDITVATMATAQFKKLLSQHKLPDAFAEVCGWRALNYLENRLDG